MALPSPNSSTNKVRKASSGSRPVVTSLASAKTAGATTATVLDATGWTTDTAVDVVIYRKDTSNNPVAGTQTDWVGTLSGTTLSNMVLRAGTEPVAGYAADSLTVVKVAPTAAFVDDLADAWYTEHKEDGTHALALFDKIYPIGSIYTNASNSTNPSSLLGFGTWEAFGAGRVMVGIDSTQTEFDTAEETGGAKTHTLTESEMPSHTHGIDGRTSSVTGSYIARLETGGVGATFSSDPAGGGQAHNNLQPYVVVYMWKRTA